MIRIAVLPMRKQAIAATPNELAQDDHSFSNKTNGTMEYSEKLSEIESPHDYTQTQIYKAFYPLMLSLKIVGLHYHRKYNKSKKEFSLKNISQLYSWSLTFLAWVSFIKSLITMRLTPGIGPQMFTNMVFSLVTLLCTLNCTAFLLASHRPKSKRKLFLCYSKLKTYGGPFINATKIRKNILIGTIIAWTVNILNSCIVAFILFCTDVLTAPATDPLTDSSVGSLVMKIIFTTGIFSLSSMFIFGSFVDLVIALLLFYEFRLFRKYFRSLLSEDGDFSGSLENERRRFLLMTRIVDAANDWMAIHHGASFTCGIANLCLMLYSLIYYPSVCGTFEMIFAYSFWIVCSVFDMTVSCVCGILINSSV